jgi:hypothetical protein
MVIRVLVETRALTAIRETKAGKGMTPQDSKDRKALIPVHKAMKVRKATEDSKGTKEPMEI